jgi:hypothetical protein
MKRKTLKNTYSYPKIEIMRRTRRNRRKSSRKKKGKYQNGGGLGRAAILIRGFYTNKCKKSFTKNIYDPLVAAGWAVDVYISTYDNKDDALLRTYPGVKDIFYQPETNRQSHTYLEGLTKIPDDYDLYMVTRFDLNYKKPVTDWMPKDYVKNANKVWVLWREYESLWNEHRRVADTIHFATRAGKKSLESVLEENKNGQLGGDLHMLYDILIKKAEIGILVDGFYDSNPSKGNTPEMKNPIYIFHKRTYSHNDGPSEKECE